VRPVDCLAQNLFNSAPYISQVAAEAAFEPCPERRSDGYEIGITTDIE
jgi:hypothetical protein